jgi:hypothetical protein
MVERSRQAFRINLAKAERRSIWLGLSDGARWEPEEQGGQEEPGVVADGLDALMSRKRH